MATATAPPKPPPRPPGGQPPPLSGGNGAATAPPAIVSGVMNRAQRAVIYGTGGIGKTSLLSLMQGVGIRPLLLDCEEGSGEIDVDRVPITSWDELLASLTSGLANGYDAVAIDSATAAEELALRWTLENVPNDSGQRPKSIEGYGYGKGYVHLYETFIRLLGILDQHIRAGRHVILTAHECVTTVPNPMGPDWVRYEPRLQSPNGGKNSIRLRLKEWTDHLLFIGYDVEVSAAGRGVRGKGVGSGSRTIYPYEMPTHMAKSRRLSRELVYQYGDATLWTELLGLERQA